MHKKDEGLLLSILGCVGIALYTLFSNRGINEIFQVSGLFLGIMFLVRGYHLLIVKEVSAL